jgi:prepilin-type N-terminal cleavage/methylation domain-containing protein
LCSFVFKKLKHNGFSLTEVLMAVGILTVGMVLIATMFPVGIYLTGVATERTMAAVVADEAFAKIQLYDFENPKSLPFDTNFFLKTYDYEQAHNDQFLGSSPCSGGSYDLFPDINVIDPNEFSYPSIDPYAASNRQYYWSALCKKLNSDPCDTQYLVTVFVARKTSSNLKYYWHDPYRCADPNSSDRPRVVDVNVQKVPPDKLEIDPCYAKYVNPPTTILVLDNNTPGRLYRVVDRINNTDANVITLDRNLDPDANDPNGIWFIPPPNTGGKNADIGVYQRIIKF